MFAAYELRVPSFSLGGNISYATTGLLGLLILSLILIYLKYLIVQNAKYTDLG